MDIFLTKEMIDCNRHLFLICCLKAYLPSTFCLNWNIKAHMKRSVIYPRDRWYCVKSRIKHTKKVIANQIILIFEGAFIGLFSPQFIHDDSLSSSCLSIPYISTTTSHSSYSDSLNNTPFEGTHTFCTCMASFIMLKLS